MSAPRHDAILLAAGGSRRLGQAKQLLLLDGEPLVRRAARALLATAPGATFVVLGAHADEIRSCLADLPLQRLVCADWQRGMGASLATALSALSPASEGALVALCDQPALSSIHLQALVDTWRAAPGRAVASAYAGVLGVPALLPRAWFGDLAGIAGDRGARDLLRQHAGRVTALPAPELAHDIDAPGDFHAAALGGARPRE